jgi:hypothetical protein
MKTMSLSSVINPTILILAALIAAVTFLALRGNSLPLLSNLKISVAIVLVLGFAMCAQGGLGYVGAAGQWTHPLAIVGAILGAAIFIVAGAIFFGFKLPLIAGPQQALIAMVALIGAKVVNSLAHYLVSRG